MKNFVITGTFHGAIVEACSEGQARLMFRRYYKGESIIAMRQAGRSKYLQNLPDYWLESLK